MHPEDVAEYLLGEVAELSARVDENPSLGVKDVRLDGEQLDIRFLKIDHPKIEARTASGLLGPGQRPIVVEHAAIDLSKRRERELILHMDCANFDCEPPTAELLQADRSRLPEGEWPKDMPNQGVIYSHPEYDRPFFCRRGLREYHSHPGHEDNPWERYRETMALYAIAIELLDDLQRRWTLQ